MSKKSQAFEKEDSRKYVAFDLEIARALPREVSDLKVYRPLGIICAGVWAADSETPRIWHSSDADNRPSRRMSTADLCEMVEALKVFIDTGYTLLSWNGLGFDFDVLAEESGMVEDCYDLARNHVDMMFHIFCAKGFGVGLDAAASGMGVLGKSGHDAADAPRQWADGEYDQVISYVANDCRIMLEVVRASEGSGQFRWFTQRGKPSVLDLPYGWLRASAAHTLPEPDTSWMDRPWKRTKFTGWIPNFGKS